MLFKENSIFYKVTQPLENLHDIGLPKKSRNVISHELLMFITKPIATALFINLNKNENKVFTLFVHKTEPILKIVKTDISENKVEIIYYRERAIPGLYREAEINYSISLNTKDYSYASTHLDDFIFIGNGWWYDNLFYGTYSLDITLNKQDPRLFLYKRVDTRDQSIVWSKQKLQKIHDALLDVNKVRDLLI